MSLIGPSGGATGWRASIALAAPPRHWVAGLPDGRTVPLEIRPDSEMPYDLYGSPVKICIFDPHAEDADKILFSGETGELLQKVGATPVVLGAFSRSSESCPPDTRLRYRLLDGEGMPADGSAPQLSHTFRQWLTAAHPGIARICALAELRTNAGVVPYLPRLRELAEESGLLTDLSEISSSPNFDPMVRRLRYSSVAIDDSPSGYFVFRCECGAARGASRSELRCLECGTRVRRVRGTERAEDRSFILLPEAVINPWYLSIAASWTGLLEEELRNLVEQVPAETYVNELLRFTDPFEMAANRLEQGLLSHSDSIRLTANLCSLDRELARAGSPSKLTQAFLIRRIAEPRSLSELTGQPCGAATLQAPALMLNIRHLRAAVQVAEDLSGVAELRPLIHRLVSTAVEKTMGRPPAYDAGWKTYLGALSRQLPIQRRSGSYHVVPGLHRSGNTPSQDRAWNVFGDPVVPTSPFDFTSPLAVSFESLSVRLPKMAWGGRKGSRSQLTKHLAFHCLTQDYVNPLAALAVAYEHVILGEKDRNPAKPDDVEEGLMGQLLLSSLWALLADPNSNPSGLLRLLTRKTHVELPSDWSEAEEFIRTSVREWLPQDTGQADFVRDAMARVLSGFHRHEGNKRMVARWSGQRKRLPARFIPALTSGLWVCLPSSNFVFDPVSWIQTNSLGEHESTVAKQLLRRGDYLVARSWPNESDVSTPLTTTLPETRAELETSSDTDSDTEPDPSQTTPAVGRSESPTIDIRVFFGTIRSWMTDL